MGRGRPGMGRDLDPWRDMRGDGSAEGSGRDGAGDAVPADLAGVRTVDVKRRVLAGGDVHREKEGCRDDRHGAAKTRGSATVSPAPHDAHQAATRYRRKPCIPRTTPSMTRTPSAESGTAARAATEATGSGS